MNATLPPIKYHSCTVEQPDGSRTVVKVREGKVLIDAMIANGIKIVKVGCRGGGCGVCRVRIIEGEYKAEKMSRKFVSEEDEANGIALACRLTPLGDLVVQTFKQTPNPE